MAYLDEFRKLVGGTIMECQRIEHDIKIMYAGMLKGQTAFCIHPPKTNINLFCEGEKESFSYVL